jgi:hypothetical protein
LAWRFIRRTLVHSTTAAPELSMQLSIVCRAGLPVRLVDSSHIKVIRTFNWIIAIPCLCLCQWVFSSPAKELRRCFRQNYSSRGLPIAAKNLRMWLAQLAHHSYCAIVHKCIMDEPPPQPSILRIHLTPVDANLDSPDSLARSGPKFRSSGMVARPPIASCLL